MAAQDPMMQHFVECKSCDATNQFLKKPAQWYCKTCKISLCEECKNTHGVNQQNCRICPYAERLTSKMKKDADIVATISCQDKFLRDVSCQSSEKVWVLSSRSTKFNLTDKNGKVQKTVASSDEPWRMALAKDGKSLYYTDIKKKVVMKMDTESGKINRLFSTGSWEPRGIGTCASGHILVCGSEKIIKYSLDGKEDLKIEMGDGGRRLYGRPEYVVESKDGSICASDKLKRVVVVVDPSGHFLFSYDGNVSSGRVEEFHPEGVATDSQQNYLVADYWNSTIHIIDQDGEFVTYLLFGQIEGPTGLSIDSDYSVWVCEYSTSSGIIKVLKYLQ